SAVEIRTKDRTVVRLETPHVRPVEMSSGDVDRQAVRELSAFDDNRLEVGAIGIGREHAAAPQVEEENAPGGVFFGLRARSLCECCGHGRISSISVDGQVTPACGFSAKKTGTSR